ncbi:acylneuraminate cytidylyltransferase family protein [Candidatus Parcubacteria bacterium]|nr:MAG: acylneuraminate cytidylyltransferase family protein [Candidatus Parcubacteria bacterium]
MYRNASVLALIPARGGSKGVPKKNLRLLAGKPLIAYSIIAAKASPAIDRVIVSTDSEEIADVAKRYGAEVPFLRPAELAEDLTPDYPVFEHCLDWLEAHEKWKPDIVVHLRPTGPIRAPKEIEEALDLLSRFPEADSVRSVHEPDKTPHKMWKLEGAFMVPFLSQSAIPEHFNMPRQLLPKVYATNANIGVVRYQTLREKKSVIGDKVLPYFVDHPQVDLDTDFDFDVAELILKKGGFPNLAA